MTMLPKPPPFLSSIQMRSMAGDMHGREEMYLLLSNGESRVVLPCSADEFGTWLRDLADAYEADGG